MFGHALLPLLARPKAIALFGLGIAATVSPLVLLLATEVSDATERAVTALLMASLPLGLLGGACGSAVKQAAWCTPSWTMPRFRQRLRSEFLAMSVVLALVASLLAMLAVRPAPGFFTLMLATSLAAFAVGCAFTGLPESNLFAFLPALLFFAPWARGLRAAIERPLAFAAVAAVIAVLAVWATFSTRTFRWAALREFASPIVVHAKFWLAARRRAKHGPERLATAAHHDAHGRARLPYADTMLDRMMAMSRATGPVAWLLLLAAGPLAATVVAVLLNIVDPPPPLQFLVGGMFLGVLGHMHVVPPSQMLRSLLPWSRRDHLVATWTWHAAMASWFALVACPSFFLLVRALGSSGWTLVDAACMAGSTLLLFPVGWRLLHRWFGQPHLVVQRSLLLLPLFQLSAPAIAALLAALIPTPPLRLIVLSVLIVVSQLVHWFQLKRDFASRDLVGASD